MRLAYIVSAYRYPEQLVRLVTRLDTPTSSFFVHVDSKTAEQTFRAMTDGLAHLSNVMFVRRHRCEWGGFGHVAASLEGIGAALRLRPTFDYALLLTGQDYPIKSNRHILDFFRQHPGHQFMEYFPVPHAGWQNGGLDRVDAWHWRMAGRHYALTPLPRLRFRRRIPGGLKPFGGSSYWCLTRQCIEYVDQYVKRNPSLVKFFRHVDVPDELFFQTIILNSPLADTVVNDNLRYIAWDEPDEGSPVILDGSHLEQLMASPKLFARKFDVTVDADVLDAIDHLVPA